MNELLPVLHISEVFGPTVQGEGPAAGRAAVFVRLGGCNLSCGPCDTPYTWDGQRFDLREQITATPLPAVLQRVDDLAGDRVSLVVISGGEPLLHQHKPGLPELVADLTGALGTAPALDVHFETNGTLVPAPWLVANHRCSFVVSPKLVGPLATDTAERRIVPGALAVWATLARAGRATFKFVLDHPDQIAAAAAFAGRHQVPARQVMVMPEGNTVERVLDVGRALVDPAAAVGFGVCTRLHVLMWPNQDRGR